MMIHSHKSTHDIEERLPEDLPPEARDAILRVAIAVRSGDGIMLEEIPERLRWMAEALAAAVRERDELRAEIEERNARALPFGHYHMLLPLQPSRGVKFVQD